LGGEVGLGIGGGWLKEKGEGKGGFGFGCGFVVEESARLREEEELIPEKMFGKRKKRKKKGLRSVGKG